jgi:prepilin-type N-terminal cleavage/methylation domain-containing protein
MLNKKDQKGFTIIEVLIVLAIAGLILLIVFLAVPALQRNNRNTQRSNDVAVILGLWSETLTNANGTPPATCTGATVGCWIRDTKLTSYDNQTANVAYTRQAAATAPTAVSAVDIVQVYTYAKCNGNAPTATGASSRSVIALYAIENSGGTTTPRCQES